jgi:hypothetical protein
MDRKEITLGVTEIFSIAIKVLPFGSMFAVIVFTLSAMLYFLSFTFF